MLTVRNPDNEMPSFRCDDLALRIVCICFIVFVMIKFDASLYGCSNVVFQAHRSLPTTFTY